MNLLTEDTNKNFEVAMIRANDNDTLMKLIDNTCSLKRLNQIKIYLEDIIQKETELFTDIREKWAIDVTKVKLRYCNSRIKHLQEEKEIISATI